MSTPHGFKFELKWLFVDFQIRRNS